MTYGYDAASRLTQVAQGSQIVGLGYDNANRRTSLTYPNGTSTSYGYDVASRLLNIAHNGPAGVIESLGYAYDSAGNRISLTRANGTASNLPAAVQAAYDAANEQIQFNSGTPNLTYDANGNLQTQTDASGTTTYTWDARNRLVAQTGPGTNATFQYDALGRRISATINGQTRQMLYDGNDIVAEIEGGAISAIYLRSLNIDEPFVRQTSTGNEFYHADATGSTQALTNPAAAITASYAYEVFGRTTISGTSSNPFQYTGRENDGTGLYYYRARYYAFALHRFVREDPIGLAGGDSNLYAYVRNNPCNLVDPFGLKCTKPFLRRAFDNFLLVNQAIPGLTVLTGSGVLTSGFVANRLGLITPMQFALSGFQGLDLGYITLTRGYTALVASGVSLFNFALVSTSYETGVAIGSLIYAAVTSCNQ